MHVVIEWDDSYSYSLLSSKSSLRQ